MEKAIRLGIIGLGTMGSVYASNTLDGKIPGVTLTAVCDADPARLGRFAKVRGFSTAAELFAASLVDAVLIATPHFSHAVLGIEAFERGLHVLMEKPICVHKADCERLIAAYDRNRTAHGRELVFAAMFNQRTDPLYSKTRRLIQTGELGEIRRVTWIITSWFRTQAYYASGGWRATWAGEGGGVLLNQCPHNLDLWQWMFGMPRRVRAFCSFGRYHDIEVEDDVTAYFEYENGATGVLITSTGETPGTNRLEIAAERGRYVIDEGEIRFRRNEVPMTEFSRTTKQIVSRPETWDVRLSVPHRGGQHNEIIANFAAAILEGAPLIAPGQEGIHSVELANAMIYSGCRSETVELPLDSAAYEGHLQQLIAGSRYKAGK